MAELREGYVERIVYRGENGYTVLVISCEEEELYCVGVFAHIEEGEFLRVEGELVLNPKYGEQLKVFSYQAVEPKDGQAMERYLASGAIKGIGTTLAARIVKKFKEDTFRIIEEEPERLAEIKGISQRLAGEIYRQFEEKREMRHAMIFLQKYGISNSLAVKIYQFYGEQMYDIMRENPYRLAEDIDGVGFKIADEIALQAGISPDDAYRVKAALYYILTQAITNGHVYLPEEELYQKAAQIIRVPLEAMERQLMQLALERSIVLKEEEGTRLVYIARYYFLELDVARMLCDLNCRYDIAERVIQQRLHQLEKELQIELDELQKRAVSEAVQNGIFILTGGPGTGKSATRSVVK